MHKWSRGGRQRERKGVENVKKMDLEKEAGEIKRAVFSFFFSLLTGDVNCISQIKRTKQKCLGKDLSTALSSVTCREVGWIWRENESWLVERYTATGVSLGSGVGLI